MRQRACRFAQGPAHALPAQYLAGRTLQTALHIADASHKGLAVLLAGDVRVLPPLRRCLLGGANLGSA